MDLSTHDISLPLYHMCHATLSRPFLLISLLSLISHLYHAVIRPSLVPCLRGQVLTKWGMSMTYDMAWLLRPRAYLMCHMFICTYILLYTYTVFL